MTDTDRQYVRRQLDKLAPCGECWKGRCDRCGMCLRFESDKEKGPHPKVNGPGPLQRDQVRRGRLGFALASQRGCPRMVLHD